MKKLALLLVLAPSIGLAQSPFFASQVECHKEVSSMEQYGTCLRTKLYSKAPNWQQDEDAGRISYYFDYLDAVAERLNRKFITEDQAREMARNELNRIVAEKPKKQYVTPVDDYSQREYDRRRQERYEQERYDQMQAMIRAQEEQARIARNNQMINTGLQLMMMGQQRQYQPPAPILPYPSDTTINVQQRPYQFYDSRPYR